MACHSDSYVNRKIIAQVSLPMGWFQHGTSLNMKQWYLPQSHNISEFSYVHSTFFWLFYDYMRIGFSVKSICFGIGVEFGIYLGASTQRGWSYFIRLTLSQVFWHLTLVMHVLLLLFVLLNFWRAPHNWVELNSAQFTLGRCWLFCCSMILSYYFVVRLIYALLQPAADVSDLWCVCSSRWCSVGYT